MAKVKVYNMQAKQVGEINLPDDLFAVEYNEPLIHEVIVAYNANQRQGTKSTLTRSEVRGHLALTRQRQKMLKHSSMHSNLAVQLLWLMTRTIKTSNFQPQTFLRLASKKLTISMFMKLLQTKTSYCHSQR